MHFQSITTNYSLYFWTFFFFAPNWNTLQCVCHLETLFLDCIVIAASVMCWKPLTPSRITHVTLIPLTHFFPMCCICSNLPFSSFPSMISLWRWSDFDIIQFIDMLMSCDKAFCYCTCCIRINIFGLHWLLIKKPESKSKLDCFIASNSLYSLYWSWKWWLVFSVFIRRRNSVDPCYGSLFMNPNTPWNRGGCMVKIPLYLCKQCHCDTDSRRR